MTRMRKIDLEALCAEKGLRITEQRRVIARVLSEAEDHPDVEEVHVRSSAIDPGISIATVYRTVRLFEEAGILERHDFGDGRSRYEAAPEPAARQEPAVSVRASIKPDFIVCLEDGKKLKMLKRHLMTHYQMTPDQYRAKWNLPADYPMVAPNYAEQRRSLAKKIGLGTRPRK